jgi:hypothetical protein
MGNMSYCRFENTLKDLRDCAENINNTHLSEREKSKRDLLIELCQEIVDEADMELEITDDEDN